MKTAEYAACASVFRVVRGGGLLGEGGACISDAPLRCGHMIAPQPQGGRQLHWAAIALPSAAAAAAAAPKWQAGGGSVEDRPKGNACRSAREALYVVPKVGCGW